MKILIRQTCWKLHLLIYFKTFFSFYLLILHNGVSQIEQLDTLEGIKSLQASVFPLNVQDLTT